MESEMQQQAVMLTEEIMRIYYCKRDIYAVLAYMAPDATWIGPGEREKKYTLKEIQEHFELGKNAIPSCEVSDPDLRAIDLGEDICLVTGSLSIRTTPESKMVVEVNQRVSVTYRLMDGALKVVHMHSSNPYGEMKREEYFPNKLGTQSYQYLQRLLREKTEVLDMITGNITGGLKGSNDDDMFSYFYVNEGLPNMLGFTYDEFIAKTGGTAVGAVYPPDLQTALSDCARCFANGPVYATEYRMEKKDGTLIWVLDSGRKALDSEGIMRINSIVTDITPLKQALFDLELERERYRVALEHITGFMCEFDVKQDLFTIYRQEEVDGKKEMKNLEYSQFSKSMQAGILVHPEDGERFLTLCRGEQSGSLEFRTCFLEQNNSWRYAEFSCSVMLDGNGEVLRSIGMLKDITEEKRKTQQLVEQAQRDGLTHLLNQTTAKEAIQAYLAENRAQDGKSNALLLLDLDHFKEINDSKGHLYGNEVLIRTAHILEEMTGKGSIVGRTGGDEFIALLPNIELDEVAKKAESIVRLIHQIGSDCNMLISCSVGIACQKDGEENFTQMFERADKTLYRAKDNGRNGWDIDKA